MIQTRKSRSIQANQEGKRKLEQAKATQRDSDGNRLSFPRIAEKASLDEKTVKSFFYGKRVDRDSAVAIIQVLGLQLTDVVDSSDMEPQTVNSKLEQKLLIHRQACSSMLVEKRRLTTNPLTTGGGTTFERKEVYIPLGLVERKRLPLRDRNISLEQGSKLYEPTDYEVTRKLNTWEFFSEVLLQGNSPKSKGRRIAIIGEPGSGKTTLLQQIADWVFEKSENDVAIWITLADLQGRSLKDYLLDVWLEDALKTIKVTADIKDALVELFNRGRVWLLLDGVDEMTADNPLQAIQEQIRGFLASARVVLTCRLNIWDAGKNALESFDVYRNLDFESFQVGQFVNKWFQNETELGRRLLAELDKPEKKRTRDLVKNPLRLALMCYSWQRRQGELPQTKAALYQRFVEVFYEWKQERFPTTSAERHSLNQALGRLAQSALDQDSSLFRLKSSFVSSVLGEPDTPMFQLARQLGWLNKVGVAAEDPEEPVYAFFHPTFQEYFAAASVGDWHFFLNHIPHNPNQGIYRIFELQWKEVIMLWLGRKDVAKEQTEEFIKALAEFEDGCGNFYRIKAYFLAKAAICELGQCHPDNPIVVQCSKWHRFKLDWHATDVWRQLHLKSSQLAGTQEQVAALIEQLQNTQDEEKLSAIIQEIAKVGAGSSEVTAALINLLHTTQNQCLCLQTVRTLREIGAGNSEVITTLVNLLENTKEQSMLIEAIWCLQAFGDGNQTAIAALSKLLQTKHLDDFIYCQTADSLWRINAGNKDAISTLTDLVKNSPDEHTRLTSAWVLGEIDSSNPTAVATLVDFLRPEQGTTIPSDALCALMHIASGDSSTLMKLLSPYQIGILTVDDSNDEGLVIVKTDTEDKYSIIRIESIWTEHILTLSGEHAFFIKAIFQEDFSAAVDALQKYSPEHLEWSQSYWPYYEDQYAGFLGEIPNFIYLLDWDKQQFNSLFDKRPAGSFVYQFAENFLWSRAQKMTYPKFYQLCHSQPPKG